MGAKQEKIFQEFQHKFVGTSNDLLKGGKPSMSFNGK